MSKQVEKARRITSRVISEITGQDLQLNGVIGISRDGLVKKKDGRFISPNCKQIDSEERTYRNEAKAYVELPVIGGNYKTGKKCVHLYRLLSRIWPEEYPDEESALKQVRALSEKHNKKRYKKREEKSNDQGAADERKSG